jgi:hypothetical protein
MELTLRNGMTVLLDDDRADLAALRGWYMHSSGRIGREVLVEGKRKVVFLHNLALGNQPRRGLRTDHKNRDVLDNRRENLREVTVSQNAQNRERTTKRGLPRGVYMKRFASGNTKWAAQGTLDYRHHHLGYFDTVEEADAAVSAWRRKHMTHSEVDKVGVG